MSKKQSNDFGVIVTMPLSIQRRMNENNIMPEEERKLRFIIDVIRNPNISPNNKIRSIADMQNMSVMDIYKNSLPSPLVKMIIRGEKINDMGNLIDKYSDYKLSYEVVKHSLRFVKTYNMSFLSYVTIMLAICVPEQYILSSLGFPSNVVMKWDAIQKYIKLARIENQLNKKEVAGKAKLSVPTYSKIENDFNIKALYNLKIYTINNILKAFKYKTFDFDVYAPIKKKMVNENLSTKCLADDERKGSYLFHVMQTRAGMNFAQYSEIMNRLNFNHKEIMASLGFPSKVKAKVPKMIKYIENTRKNKNISQKALTANAKISSGYYRLIVKSKKTTISVVILHRLANSLK